MKAPRTRLARFVADKTLAGGGSSPELAREVAAYLLAEGRTNELDSVLRDVQADWAEAGFVEVVAASARPLAAEVRKEIEATVRRLYPTAKKIILTEVRDADVIGGVRLTLANQQLDLSVEAKLNKFKQLTTA